MLILDGKPLSYDRAFTHNGIQYPANWLRLTSLKEKEAIGIQEAPDPPYYDQRFYWSANNPKQLDDKTETINGEEVKSPGIRSQWIAEQNRIANALLQESDWRVVKAQETSTELPTDWKTYRTAVRTACNARQAEIAAAADTPALKELLFGSPTIQQEKKDSDGNLIVDEHGLPVFETVANPAIATAWPSKIS